VTDASERSSGWTRTHLATLAGGLLVGTIIRLILLPTDGLRGDLDQFVLWVHGIATDGIGSAYDQNLSFPPVMALIWGMLAAVQPAFATVTDGADPAIRVLMKLPATLADIGLAAAAAWALRGRPGWAVVGALAIWLHPAVIDISAWWGQYESIYALAGFVAFLLAANRQPGPAAVALGIAVMTKPQALPFLVPFGAWYLGRFGLLGAARYGLVGAATIAVLWLPFVAAAGPANYLRNLGQYQNDIFAVLSLRAWNPWWILQGGLGSGDFVGDGNVLAGPVTYRLVGLVAAALLALLVFVAVHRRPTSQTLALGLGAITLVAFTALTTMHERYAFAAVVFLVPLLPDRRVLAVWLLFSVVFTLNLIGAVPPTVELAALVPGSGLLTIAGSVAITALTAAVLWLVVRESGDARGPASEPAPERDEVPVEVVG
jgi:dolichyl-phosphate-mannose-protein mannosyltransferase